MVSDLFRTCSCGACHFDWARLKWFRWAVGEVTMTEWLETGTVCKCGTRLLRLGETEVVRGDEQAAV